MDGSLVAVLLSLLFYAALSKPQENAEHRRYFTDHVSTILRGPSGSSDPVASMLSNVSLWKRSIPAGISEITSLNSTLSKRSDGASSISSKTEHHGHTLTISGNNTGHVEHAKNGNSSSADIISHLQKRYVAKSAQKKKKKGQRRKMRGKKKGQRGGSRRNKEHNKRETEDTENAGTQRDGGFSDTEDLREDLDEKREDGKSAGLFAAGQLESLTHSRLTKRDITEANRGNSTSSKVDSSKRKKKKKPTNVLSTTGKGEKEFARLSDRYKGRLLNKIVIKANNNKSPLKTTLAKGNSSKEDPGKRDTRHVSYASGQLSKKDHLPSIITKDDKTGLSKDKTREKRWRRGKRRGRGRRKRRRRRRRRRRRHRGRPGHRRRRRCRRGMCRRRRRRRRRRPRNDVPPKNSTVPAKNAKTTSSIKSILNAKRLKRFAEDGLWNNSTFVGNKGFAGSHVAPRKGFSMHHYDRGADDLIAMALN